MQFNANGIQYRSMKMQVMKNYHFASRYLWLPQILFSYIRQSSEVASGIIFFFFKVNCLKLNYETLRNSLICSDLLLFTTVD